MSPCQGGASTSALTPNGLAAIPGLFVPSSRPGTWLLQGLSYHAEIMADGMVVTSGGHRMAVRFEGASHSAAISAQGSPVLLSDLRSRSSVPARRAVSELMVRDVYPGVDVRLTAPHGALKTEYIVHAGAHVDAIRIAYSPVERLSLLDSGALRVDTASGPWFEQAPSAAQTGGLSEEPVDVRFVVGKDGTVGFRAAAYDPHRDLVIDPQLTFASLLSGTGMSVATGVKVDAYGNVYVAGYTDATDFAETAPSLSGGGGVDSFLLKLAPGGTQILFLVLIGGSGDDRVNGLALDADGVPCLVGTTISPDFPTANASQSSLSGGRDGFVLKVSADGTYLLFSTFLGGAGEEWANAVAIHGDDVWVGGNTTSTDFPVVSAYQSTRRGAQNGFVTRFSGSGVVLSSTYVGGTGTDEVRALIVNSLGEPVIAGSSCSSDLPVAASAFQTTRRGQQDGFVLRFNSSATAVLGGSYLGGSLGDTATPEAVQGIAVAIDGSYWIGGFTPSLDFPLVNPWNATVAPGQTGFIARLSGDFSSLLWSTMVGGASNSLVDALQADASGGVYVSGKTSASDFPLVSPIQSCPSGTQDGILIHYGWGASAPDLSTCYGGSANEEIRAIAVHPNGRVYFAGSSGSSDAVAVNAIETPSGGAIWAVVGELMNAVRSAVPSAVSPNAASGSNQTFRFNFTHPDGAQYIRKVYGLINTVQSQANGCALSYDAVNNLLSLANDAGTFPLGVAPGSFLSLSNHQCTVDVSTASVTLSGTTLQVSVSVAFGAAFSVNATIWGQGYDTTNTSSGWVALGAVNTVTNHAPVLSAPSVIGNGSSANSGNHVSLKFVVTDGDGVNDVVSAIILINSSFATPAACMPTADRIGSLMWLLNDAASSFQASALTTGTDLTNHQCTVYSSRSSITQSGESLIFNVEIDFNNEWEGTKTIWVSLVDSTRQFPFVSLGAFTVQRTNHSPVLRSISPLGASGLHQKFQIGLTEPDGPSDLGWVAVVINQNLSLSQGCYVSADPSTNLFWLYDDAIGTYYAAPAGSPGTIGNARCSLLLPSSSISVTGNNLVATLDLVFSSNWSGVKNIYEMGADHSELTDWVLQGPYTVVPGSADPVPLLATVGTVDGRTQKMTLSAYYPDGKVAWLGALVAAASSGGYGCLFTFDITSHLAWLLKDDAVSWAAAPLGTPARLENSQCSIDLQNSSITSSGNVLTANAVVEFSASSAGQQVLYSNASNGTVVVPWVQWGTFTVSSANVAPVIQSVTPSTVSSTRQTLKLTVHDSDGPQDFRWGQLLINSAFTTAHGCFLSVDAVTNLVWLLDDSGSQWSAAHLQSDAVVSNHQCSIYAKSTSYVGNGSTVSISVDVEFNPAWKGEKGMYAMLADSVHVIPWAEVGEVVAP